MTKLQITLTNEEADLLSAKAAQFGYKLTRFVKFLISKEAAEIANQNSPVFKMSEKSEKVALRALKEHKKGKTKEIASFKELQ